MINSLLFLKGFTMYRYETHLHTFPVSKCAKVSVRENLEFYKSMGYDGVFITNHFIDGNISAEPGMSYAELIEYYFSDIEEGKRLSAEIGIKVFEGVEMSYKGTDFLVYGLDKQWFLAHPEITEMKKRDELELLMANGALVIQAHPFREAGYINHIRLFPRSVNGVEVFNACRTELENEMADIYAAKYDLIKFAGSDNHIGKALAVLTGIETETPISDEADFVSRIKNNEFNIFSLR